MPLPKGVPTADQEALQAPSVDPVMTLANAAVFGPITAGKGLLSQILLSATGGWLGKGQMGQFAIKPNVTQVHNDVGDAIFEKMIQHVTGGRPAETMNDMSEGELAQLMDYSKVLNWVLRMTGKGGPIFSNPNDIFPEP